MWAALLLAAVPATGQESPLPDLFSDVIDVRVVNVEVVVTGKKGNRIRGLQANDFELQVDGDPVPIDYFTEIDDGRALAASDKGVGNVPSVTADEPVGTNYLIFIDDLLAIKQRRNRVLKHLERDLVGLGPADRVAVVAYDGSGLTRIADWTGSRDEIERALLRARQRKARGLMNTFGMGDTHGLTRRSVMAAAGTLRSFANAPGRKVMLMLIEGWGAGYDSWNAQSSFLAATTGVRLDRLYAPLVHAANLVGYSLYPIDLPGLRPRVYASFGTQPLGMAAMARMPPAMAAGNSPERSFHDLLRFLADETGGLPMINSFSNKALAETREDTRSYYWLGFEPPRNEDDRLHDIEVRVAGRRDLRVRTRENYLDMSKGTEVTMLVEGALLFGGSPGAEALKCSSVRPGRRVSGSSWCR